MLRGVQPAPKLGEWVEVLAAILRKKQDYPGGNGDRRSGCSKNCAVEANDGAHDSVHRFAKAWRSERARGSGAGVRSAELRARRGVPRFDWSHETITPQGPAADHQGGAHEACRNSRMLFVRAHFRETQELVYDAHDKAFLFFGGVCRRGIYDNMKTAVEAIFVGKARQAI